MELDDSSLRLGDEVTAAKHAMPGRVSRAHIGHTKKVMSLAWSADGYMLASGGHDMTVRLWTLEQQTLRTSPLMSMAGHTGVVEQVAWHPTDNNILASCAGDKTVRIWDAKRRKCTKKINTKGSNISLTWSPDGAFLAVGNKDDQISLIDANTGIVTEVFAFNFEVNETAWSRDGKVFLVGTGDGYIHLSQSPKLQHRLNAVKAHDKSIYCLRFDPSYRYLATGGADSLVTLFDASELVCLRSFTGLDRPVRYCCFSHDSQFIAMASEEKFIDVCHVGTGTHITKIQVEGSPTAGCWHPKRHLLAYVEEGNAAHRNSVGSVYLWE